MDVLLTAAESSSWSHPFLVCSQPINIDLLVISSFPYSRFAPEIGLFPSTIPQQLHPPNLAAIRIDARTTHHTF